MGAGAAYKPKRAPVESGGRPWNKGEVWFNLSFDCKRGLYFCLSQGFFFATYFVITGIPSLICGLIVSFSTKDDITPAEMTVAGFRFTFALAVLLCLALGVLMFVAYIATRWR